MASKFDSKRVFWILLNVLLVVASILGLMWAKSVWISSNATVPSRTINITAEGKTLVAPDIAQFSFSVVAEGKDPEKLATDNTAKMNAAIDFVKSQGVEAKDIKTAGYNLSPKYDYDRKTGRSFINGYTLTQTVFVKVRDFAKVGKLIGSLPTYGINDISSLTFDIENPDKFLNEARRQAFEKARAKADAMAKQNGVRISRVINFYESSGGYPRPYFAEAYAKGGGMGGPVLAPTPAIEPGSQEVTVNVSVTYEIR